ncbi:MAG: glycogen synthase GlgA [Nitrospirota bacterium]
MNVLIASSEAVPFCKTGGLADVVGALPKELEKLKVNVSLILPLYRIIKREGLKKMDLSFTVPISDRTEEASIWKGKTGNNIPVYFIEKDKYYDRPELYQTAGGDYPDNAERFIFFSRAILEALKAINLKPDLIHCNDWQTAMVPIYLKTLYRVDPYFKKTSSLLTIHNLGYQGIFWHFDMHLTGLGWEYFTIEGIEFYGKINLLKGGMIFSDIINTVSRTYSKEIQTEKYGFGLDGVLRKRKADLYGIINGIDYDEWNPETDKSIPARYSLDNINGKALCKKTLQREMGLKERGSPLIGMITRLTSQKGLDILSESIEDLMQLDLQLLILGEGEERYHRTISDISERYPDKIGLKIGFDPILANKIYAGSDFFLMPSRYEPCGLGQLISLRYGTIPIVRKTGGLADTVKEFNPKSPHPLFTKGGQRGISGNGFLFEEYSAKALLKSVKKAVSLYQNKNMWKSLLHNAISSDFSWGASAKKYLSLYRKAIKMVGKRI